MKPRASAAASGVPARLRPHLPRVTAFLIVFSVGYSLGILSSSTRPSTPKPSQTVIRPHAAHLTAASSAGVTASSNGTGTGYPRSPPHDLFRFGDECGKPVPADDVVKTLLDKLFDGESPYASFPPAHTAALLHPAAARPRGWGSTGAVFAELIEEVRPDVIVELGAFLGASALHMAAVARNLSLSPAILCVDDFRGWPAFRGRFRRDVPPQRHGDALLLPQFMANVLAAGPEAAATVLPLPFSTASTLAALCQWGVYADLIEVDAGHDFHSAWADINLAWAVHTRRGRRRDGRARWEEDDQMCGLHSRAGSMPQLQGWMGALSLGGDLPGEMKEGEERLVEEEEDGGILVFSRLRYLIYLRLLFFVCQRIAFLLAGLARHELPPGSPPSLP